MSENSEATIEVGEVSSTELIWAIAKVYGAFADRSKMIGQPNLYHGVSVLQHKDDPDLFRFMFRTRDDLEFASEVCMRDVNREYIDNLVEQCRRTLYDARSKKDALDVNIVTQAVRGAVNDG